MVLRMSPPPLPPLGLAIEDLDCVFRAMETSCQVEGRPGPLFFMVMVRGEKALCLAGAGGNSRHLIQAPSGKRMAAQQPPEGHHAPRSGPCVAMAT